MLLLLNGKSHHHVWRTMVQTILIIFLYSFQSTINAQSTLVLNVVGQPPLNTKTHDGFMDDVVREAIRRIGYRLVMHRFPAERGLRNANNGLIDGEMSRVKGMDKLYPNLMRVPEKIMDWEFCVFSKKPIKLHKGWDSLANRNVAFITGWKILEKNVPRSAEITKTRNSQQLFTLLKLNRADFIIYERWGGSRILNKSHLYKVKLRQPCLASKAMFIYLHKKHRALVPRLSRALADMKKDGSYRRYVRKYLTPVKARK